MAYWLLKTEPESFGYDDLVRAGREGWDGIRNYQARIFLRQMQRGDQVIIYHSNAKPPGAAGIAQDRRHRRAGPHPVRPGRASTTTRLRIPADPRWDWVTVAPVRKLRFVSLDELRAMPELASSRLLARGNRLSVIPLAEHEFDAIVRAGT